MRFSRLALSASIAAGTSVHAFGGHVAQSTMSMGTIKVFELNFTESFLGVDCFERPTILVNGQFPGPEIRVTEGDVIQLTVRNFLYHEALSVHLHGLDQPGTPFYDGVGRISQTPILPGDSYTIRTRTTIGRAGTYMYHAHSGLLTVDGALIVDGTGPRSQQALKYDEERTIMLQDWWHTTPQQQMIGLLSSPTFRWIGDPSSILINGRTKSSPETCTPVSATNSTPLYATDFSTIPVTLGKTYRLRFIGATSLAYLSVAIAGHNLTVIEVDGSLVTPVVVDHIDVAPGQRYSVLMTADQPIGDYWMATAVRWRPSGPKNGLAIIRYDSAVRTTSYTQLQNLPTLPAETIEWDSQFTAIATNDTCNRSPPLGKADTTLVLEGRQYRTSDGFLRWGINNISYMLPTDQKNEPLLSRAYAQRVSRVLGKRPTPTLPDVIELALGSVVDIVLQNMAGPTGACEVHPWHLHGHSFWVLGYGPGHFNDAPVSIQTAVLPSPVFRDVVNVYPYAGAYFQKNVTVGPGRACGWKRIRFVADNAGVWPFHCHIPAHMVMGMMVVFGVGLNDLPRMPAPL